MTLIDLANPTRFTSLATRALPWLASATAILLAIGLYQSAMAPDDYQQGATVKIMFIHVPNAWLSMFVWGVMSVAALGTLVWRHPLADVAAKAAAPIGAAFTFLALVTGSLARGGGSVAGRPRGCDPDAGGRHQSSDHQILGGLVEYLAPAGIGDADSRTDARPRLPDSASGDGVGIFAAVRHAASGSNAQRDPATPSSHAADDPGDEIQSALGMNAMSLGPYATFIVTSYLLVAAVVVLLIGWIAIDYRRQKRRLGELEAGGAVRRSGRSATDIK
jgi:heme exporter protein CcmD